MITKTFHANSLWVKSEYKESLIALSSKIREKIVDKPLPTVLYHYTTLKGLIGILESQRLWATNALCLNDASELTYGFRLITNEIKSVRESATDFDYKNFLGDKERMMDDPKGPVGDCYMVCFCENGDLLSQWRSYGDRGGGCSIGFSANEIGMKWSPPPNFLLRKIIYDSAEQKEIVSSALSMTYEASRELTSGKTNADAKHINVFLWHFLQDHLHDILLSFKHPSFSQEEEWRLIEPFHAIERDHHSRRLKFRVIASDIVPFVELDISPAAGVNTGRLPVKEINLGPISHPDLSERTTSMLLEKYGYCHIKLNSSGIPLR